MSPRSAFACRWHQRRVLRKQGKLVSRNALRKFCGIQIAAYRLERFHRSPQLLNLARSLRLVAGRCQLSTSACRRVAYRSIEIGRYRRP